MQIEQKLQASCVLWFSQTYPTLRGALFATFSSQSAADAAQKLSLGMVKSLPDLIYIEEGMLIGIELKAKGSRHNAKHLREQCQWLRIFPSAGCFCDSLEMFQQIITLGAIYGIPPYKVYDKLVGISAQSVDWDKLVASI